MPNSDLVTVVNAANLASVSGILLLGGLFVLSRSGARVGSIEIRLSDYVFGSLLLALVVPLFIVAGVGPYILHANTGYYGRPDDFRNSAAFVNGCWFFVLGVAPTLSLLGLALLGLAAVRRWRGDRSQAPPPDSRHRS
jgi:hypothetical protein